MFHQSCTVILNFRMQRTKSLLIKTEIPQPQQGADFAHPGHSEHYKYNEFMRFMNRVSDGEVKIENSQQPIHSWTDEFASETSEAGATAAGAATTSENDSDWVRDFAEHKAKQGINGDVDANIFRSFIFVSPFLFRCG